MIPPMAAPSPQMLEHLDKVCHTCFVTFCVIYGIELAILVGLFVFVIRTLWRDRE